MTLSELHDVVNSNSEYDDAELFIGHTNGNEYFPVLRISLVEDAEKRVIVFHRETIDAVTHK
jgi:hypothetical protein